MFRHVIRIAAVAAVSATLLGTTQARASGWVSQEASPTYWGAAGDHADLVLYYDHSATGPLNILGFYFVDLSGNAVSQVLIKCGATRTAAGLPVLQPGQYCFARAYRSPASLIAKIVVGDNTPSSANITANVRASLEIRDAHDTPIVHAELR